MLPVVVFCAFTLLEGAVRPSIPVLTLREEGLNDFVVDDDGGDWGYYDDGEVNEIINKSAIITCKGCRAMQSVLPVQLESVTEYFLACQCV